MSFVDELKGIDIQKLKEDEQKEEFRKKADAIIDALKKSLVLKRKEREINSFQCYFYDGREDDGEWPRIEYTDYVYSCCEEDENKFTAPHRFCISPKSNYALVGFGNMASCPKNEFKDYFKKLLEVRLEKLGFQNYSVKFHDINYYEVKFIGYKLFATIPNVLFISVKW